MQPLPGVINDSETTRDYRVARLCDDNLADVEKLHAAVYNRPPAPGFFEKKYDTAFTGVRYTAYLAYSGQTPIAFYAVIPCFIRFDDRILLSAQSADTMTHPQYRNKGLFIELAHLTFQLCRSAGISLIFGFPNQNSLPGFINKLGWTMPGRMDCFIIPAAPFGWAGFAGKFSFLKSRYIKYRQNILAKYTIKQYGLANSVVDDGYAGVYRDHHYRKYKTYSETQIIMLGKAVLWVKVSGILLIGDIAVKEADFDEMIKAVKKLAGRLGIKEIHFHATGGTTLHSLFAKSFASVPSFPVIFKDLEGGAPVGKIKFTSADIDTF